MEKKTIDETQNGISSKDHGFGLHRLHSFQRGIVLSQWQRSQENHDRCGTDLDRTDSDAITPATSQESDTAVDAAQKTESDARLR